MDEGKRSSQSGFWLFLIGIVLLAGVIGGVLLVLQLRSRTPAAAIAWTDFKRHIANGDFRRVSVRDGGADYEFTGDLKDPPGRPLTTHVPTSAIDGPGWAALQDLATKGKAELEFQPSSRWPPR